jgi:hypothetical protein
MALATGWGTLRIPAASAQCHLLWLHCSGFCLCGSGFCSRTSELLTIPSCLDQRLLIGCLSPAAKGRQNKESRNAERTGWRSCPLFLHHACESHELKTALAPGGAGGRQSCRFPQKRQPVSRCHWNQSDVRGLLYARHGRVCAFCGCDLPRNDQATSNIFGRKERWKKIQLTADTGGWPTI